jgi:virginiamycin B lyase
VTFDAAAGSGDGAEGAPPADVHMVGDIRTYADPTGSIVNPTGIIGVPDGDMWFTSIGNGRVGRIHPSDGTIETFEDPAGQVSLPANIFPGVDGRVWFTCLGSNRLGSIDPSATDPADTIRTYAHTGLEKPVALKSDPTGRLWFSLRGSNALASIDPRDPEPSADPAIVRHPDIVAPAALFIDPAGRLWWVNGGNDTIGCLDTAAPDPGSTLRIVRPPAGLGGLRGWSLDRHGMVWLTAQRPAALIRIDPEADDVAAALHHVTDARLRTPDGIWQGADDSLWFADTGAQAIVRFDPAGAVDPAAFRFFGQPPLVQGPFDIKPPVGPADRSLWFTDKEANTLGCITT